MREIGLAEFQQKRHLERVKAGAPMREGENASTYVSPAFQWLPRGICQESAFNCFIARETHQSHLSEIRLIQAHPNAFCRLTQLIHVVRKEVKSLLETASAWPNSMMLDVS